MLDPARTGDVELIAALLGERRGTPSLSTAASLLEWAGDLTALGRSGTADLEQRPGVGPALAARLLAALELGRRVTLRALAEERKLVGSYEAVVGWARPRLAALDHEEVWVLGLDGRNGLRAARCVARGGLHGCALTPRDVLRPAVRDAASAIVLVHNHPSGDPEPSPDDVKMTRAVAAACDVVGIALLDHVIVARGGASSLLELGAIRG